MRTQVCAVIESNSTKHKRALQIVYFSSFTIKNAISAIFETKPTIAQVVFVIPEEVFPSVQRCNIQFMLLMTQNLQ